MCVQSGVEVRVRHVGGAHSNLSRILRVLGLAMLSVFLLQEVTGFLHLGAVFRVKTVGEQVKVERLELLEAAGGLIVRLVFGFFWQLDLRIGWGGIEFSQLLEQFFLCAVGFHIGGILGIVHFDNFTPFKAF